MGSLGSCRVYRGQRYLWEFARLWGPILVFLYEGSCHFESILGAPDSWKFPCRGSIALLQKRASHAILGLGHPGANGPSLGPLTSKLHGCFYNLGVPFKGILVIRAPLLGGSSAPDFGNSHIPNTRPNTKQRRTTAVRQRPTTKGP